MGEFVLDAAGVMILSQLIELMDVGQQPPAIACLVGMAIIAVAGFEDHDFLMIGRDHIFPFGNELFIEFFALAKTGECNFDVLIRLLA